MADPIRRKRVLIAMIEVGGCHASIANAVKAAMEALCPNRFDIEVVDLPRACGARQMDRFIKQLWLSALARPVLTTRLNTWMDEVSHLVRSNAIVTVLFQEFMRKGMDWIQAWQPDLIVCTHFFCTSVATFARQRHRLACGIVSHVSDPFLTHALWVNPMADELIACSEEARAHLVSLGQSADTLTVLPFPIHPRFFQPVGASRSEILEGLGLDPSRPTVLASAGGEGIGNLPTYIRHLHLSNLPVNILAVCGRNERLLRELRLLALRSSRVGLIPLGFVHNMNELAEAADVGLVKAGPSTLFELLARQCPVMVTQVAANIEKGNLAFVLGNGLGWDVQKKEAFHETMEKLLVPGFLSEARGRIVENGYLRMLPGSAQAVAGHLVSRYLD